MVDGWQKLTGQYYIALSYLTNIQALNYVKILMIISVSTMQIKGLRTLLRAEGNERGIRNVLGSTICS